jgi:hypothetical protein
MLVGDPKSGGSDAAGVSLSARGTVVTYPVALKRGSTMFRRPLPSEKRYTSLPRWIL